MAERLELEIAVDEALNRLREVDAALAKNQRTVDNTGASYASLDDLLAEMRSTISTAKTSTDAYTASSQSAGQAAGKMSDGVDLLARSVSRANPALAGKIALLRSLVAGGPLVLGVTIGVTAVAAVMNRVREEAKKAEEETRKVIAAFTDLARVPSASAGVVSGVQTLQADLARIDAEIARWERTASIGSGPLGVGGAAGAVTEELRKAYDERTRLIAAAADEIARVETGALRTQQQRDAAALASLISSNQATEAEIARANRVRASALASLAILEGDGSSEATAQRATLLGIIERINGAYEAQERVGTRAQEAIAAAAAKAAAAASAAARASEEAATALRAYRDNLLEAVTLGVASRDEINAIRDRYDEVGRLLEDQNLSLERRVELKAEELRIEERLGKVGISATRRFSGDFTPSVGLATPGRALQTPEFEKITRLTSAWRAEVVRLDAEMRKALEPTSQMSPALTAAAEGLLSLDRTLRFLPDSARSAVQGVVDITRGVQAIQAAESGVAGVVAKIGGATGIVGGIISLGVGILKASDEAKAKAQAAREALQRSIRDFVNPMEGFGSEVARAAALLDQIAGGTAFRENFARSFSDSARALDFLAREAARLGDSRAGDVVQELVRRLNESRDAFQQEIEVLRVRAEFGDEAAAQLQRSIALEAALSRARSLGISEALVQEAFAAQERRRLREEQEALEAEAIRRQQEAAEARAAFLADLERREAFAAGNGVQFDIAAAFAERIREAEEALAAGTITAEEYGRAVALAGMEQEEALEAIAAAARAAQDAIDATNRSLEQEIAVRDLMLAGKEEEARLLQDEIRFRERINRLLAEGADPAIIARLEEQERRRIQQEGDRAAVEDVIRSSQRRDPSRTTSITGLSEAQGVTIADVARNQLVEARRQTGFLVKIATNTEGGGTGAAATFSGPRTIVNVYLPGVTTIEDPAALRRAAQVIGEEVARKQRDESLGAGIVSRN